MKKIFVLFFIISSLAFSTTIDELAYQVAVINNNGAISKNDISVKRSKYLLQNISKHVVETPQQVADMSVIGMQSLENKYGIKVSLITILEEMNKTLMSADLPSNQKYLDLLTMYVLLLANG
ncbi:hypothetical protein PM10SUCC1_14740 [Propionigenium maris DSM 9537]|uniref:Uncharacterized protein n=1 Tax=Propionigenium maris DSM 9537 TaxID=1123000 RepID=A0A9W6GKR1_9FUSO|nr:hypothetical protein [Propionigenium maris]GLI55960.1 hypothetical protein PM10SUCC1_14740 [Propionigenium maris DSM 9537]